MREEDEVDIEKPGQLIVDNSPSQLIYLSPNLIALRMMGGWWRLAHPIVEWKMQITFQFP